MPDLLTPLMRRGALGWACSKCQFACLRIGEAVEHAARTHGAEITMDSTGNVFDGKTLRVPYEIL